MYSLKKKKGGKQKKKERKDTSALCSLPLGNMELIKYERSVAEWRTLINK